MVNFGILPMRLDNAWMNWGAVLLLGLAVAGCDPQRISELEEGVSTEADVRARFGAPEAVWDGPGGARVFEYNRNPSGHQNYMIDSDWRVKRTGIEKDPHAEPGVAK